MASATILIGEHNYFLLSEEEKKEWEWFDEYSPDGVKAHDYSYDRMREDKIKKWEDFCWGEKIENSKVQVFRKFFKSFPKAEEKKWSELFVHPDLDIRKGKENQYFCQERYPMTRTLYCGNDYYESLSEEDKKEWKYAYSLSYQKMFNEECEIQEQDGYEEYEWYDGIFLVINSWEKAMKLAGVENMEDIETSIYCKRFWKSFTYKDLLKYVKFDNLIVEDHENWNTSADGLSDELSEESKSVGL